MATESTKGKVGPRAKQSAASSSPIARKTSKALRKSQPAQTKRTSTSPSASRPGPQKSAAEKPTRGKRPPRNPLDSVRIAAILDGLAAAYPQAECALLHRSPWELLVATILSAQCTDARVNLVTPALFHEFPTPSAFAEASLPAIEEIIRPTGFFRNKAKSISGAARRLVAEFHGEVPQTMDELLTLPGVARKTANVVLGVAFKIAVGVVVDTHVLRLSRRLELTTSSDPKVIELDLMRIIPPDHWIAFSHELIHHGRQICVARKPRCIDCTIEPVCYSSDKTWSSH